MNNQPEVIGLTGQKRSGKSTAAYALSPYYARLSFASPLKRMIAALGVTTEESEDKEAIIPRFGKSTRFLWQTLGTQWGRDTVLDSIWVDLARIEAKKHLAMGMKVVFDDVRFNNEAKLIRELGGWVWQIERAVDNEHTDGHVSEAGVARELVDLFIYNNGAKDHLTHEIRREAGIPTLRYETLTPTGVL